MLPWKPKVKHSDTVARVTIFSFANTIKKVVAFGSSNTCFTKNANEDFGMLYVIYTNLSHLVTLVKHLEQLLCNV